MADMQDYLTRGTLLEYGHDLLTALQEFNDAKREQIDVARKWDEFMARGLALGQFTGKNEAARFGEAIEDNTDLYFELCRHSDKALEKEHKYKEMLVVDKWISRTLRMMELERPVNISDPNLYYGDTSPITDDATYNAELKKLMARRLNA